MRPLTLAGRSTSCLVIALILALPAIGSGVASAAPATLIPASTAAPCTTGDLKGSLYYHGVAAGTVRFTLLLRNESTSECLMGGFPGVSFVKSKKGRQVGRAAFWHGSRAPVTIQPGDLARAVLSVSTGDWSRGTCRATPVAGLRVYPPNQTLSLFIRIGTKTRHTSACTNRHLRQLVVGGF